MMINIKRIVLVAAYRYEYYLDAFEVIKYHPFNHLVRLAIRMINAQVFAYENFPKNSRLSQASLTIPFRNYELISWTIANDTFASF